MSLSQLQQISDIAIQVDSPANAANGAGVIYVRDIEVNANYIGTLDFYIYDLNADTGYTGEPFLVTQGTTSVSQEGELFIIYVQRELNLLADGDGSISFEIQFQDQSDPLQPNFVVDENLSLSEQLELFEDQKDSSGRTHQKQTHGAPDATFSTDPNDPEVEIKLDPGVLPTDKTEEEYLESQRAAQEETKRQEDERLRELAARQARELAEQEAKELAEQLAAQEAAELAAEEKRLKEIEEEEARLAEQERLEKEEKDEAKRLKALEDLRKEREDRIAGGVVFSTDDYEIPPPSVGTDGDENPLQELFNKSTKEIQDLIKDKSPEASKDIFLDYNNYVNSGVNFSNNQNDISKLNLIRNPEFWGSGIEGITGISPYFIGKKAGKYNKKTHGVAITPRHVLVAAHPPSAREPIDNEKILFITRDNEIIERTIIGRSSSWNLVYDETMDFTIFLLDEDLPKEIEILKTYPSELIEEIPNSKLNYKVSYTGGTTVTYTNEYTYRIQDPSFAFATNQDETTSILKLTGLTFDYNKPTGDLFSQVRWVPGFNRAGGGEKVDIQWFTSFRENDSSSPIMSVLNNQLVLASVATRTINGSFTGGTLGNKILNDLITEVDKAAGVLTGYNVTPFDPNKPPFTELPGPNNPPVNVDPGGTVTETGTGTNTESGRTHGKTYTLQIFNQSSNRQNINTTPGIGEATVLENNGPDDLIEMTSNVNAFEFELSILGDLDIDLIPFRANITNRELLSEQGTRFTIGAQVAGEDETGNEFTIGTIYIRDRIPITEPPTTEPPTTEPPTTEPPTTTGTGITGPGPTGTGTTGTPGPGTTTTTPSTTGFGPGPTGTPVTIPPPFTNIIPGGGVPPPTRIDIPTEIPPPDIPIIPFTPADCGTPPVVRLGLPPQEDPEFVPPEILEEPVIEEIFLYPAPVNSFTAPFLSDIDFNTNFTKKEPEPFNFDEEVETTINEAPVSAPNVKINLCEEEECSELGF